MDGVTKWEDEAIVNRTNVCDRQRRFSNGELQLRDTLSVFIADFASIDSAKALFELSEDGTIPLKPGIVAVLLDELARRAGFTWRNRFVSDIIDENDKQNNKTCTILICWYGAPKILIFLQLFSMLQISGGHLESIFLHSGIMIQSY